MWGDLDCSVDGVPLVKFQAVNLLDDNLNLGYGEDLSRRRAQMKTTEWMLEALGAGLTCSATSDRRRRRSTESDLLHLLNGDVDLWAARL